MTNKQVTRIIKAIEILTKETNVKREEIIDILTGFCWDEEVAGEIKWRTTND